MPARLVPAGHAVPQGGHVLASDDCCLGDLLDPPYVVSNADREALDLSGGWTGRWSAAWKAAGSKVACPVRDLAAPPAGSGPVRAFTWRAGQRHRPGLGAMASTGRLHGFESLEEQRLLLALDFCGNVTSVLSQPFRLRFMTSGGGRADHVPDFLALTADGTWLIDVRPAALIKAGDRVKFAATAEAALSRGWGYLVASGWKPHVQSVLDAFSAQRRSLTDPLGIQRELLDAAAGGPLPFRALAGATSYPVIGRAHALHLLWHRRLGASLSAPFGDESRIWAARKAGTA